MKNRQRGRNGGKPRPHQHQQGRSQNFEGNNNMRMRGNAQQLMEKFLQLARDASSQGDRVMAENYFQHADHYYRVINARFEQQNNGQRRPDQQRNDRPYDNNDQFSDYNQPNYGNSNALPQTPMHDAPPQQVQPQPQQPQFQPQPQQSHQPRPQHQPQQQPDSDIGLPPQILGSAPLPAPPAEPASDSDEQGGRPRQPRRRRGGREGAETATETAE